MLAKQLPDPQILNRLFTDLLDLKTEVFKGKSLRLQETGDLLLVASYENENKILAGLCICDIQAANRMGSALTMIPADTANKSIRDNRMSDDIIDNLKEVMNVVTGFLNAPQLPHFKLKDIFSSNSELPASLTKLAESPDVRLDLEVNLQNYGQGHMSILLGDMSGPASRAQ